MKNGATWPLREQPVRLHRGFATREFYFNNCADAAKDEFPARATIPRGHSSSPEVRLISAGHHSVLCRMVSESFVSMAMAQPKHLLGSQVLSTLGHTFDLSKVSILSIQCSCFASAFAPSPRLLSLLCVFNVFNNFGESASRSK